MARTRKVPAGKSTKQTSSGDALTCPECGKTFTRPASLGAHRNRAHGVAGASTRRSRGRNRTHASRRPAGRTRSRASSPTGDRRRIDRDALLQTIFPDGVPAREQVIRRANAWLDEAEQLAATRQ